MPAKTDPRIGLRFVTLRIFVLVASVLAGAVRPAHAQEVECDPHDKEVRSLSFEGNRTFTDDELATRVLTTPSSFTRRYFRIIGARRCYPNVGLGPDVAALTTLYRNNGFYQATVDTVVTPVTPTSVKVTFRITEGEPLHVDSLEITGLDSVPDPAEITRSLELKPGGRFGIVLMYADIDSIRARLRNAGYPQANIFKSYSTHVDQLRAEVELDAVPGPRTRFGTVNVQSVGVGGGPPAIDSAVVLRLLGFRTRDWYSDRALSEAQRNLYQTGAYRHVGVTVDSAAGPADSVAGVLVDLREDYMHQVDGQVGWATLDCFRTNAQYTDKNFLNDAQHLELTGRLSKLGYGAPTSSAATRNLCYRHDLDKDSIASSKVNYFAGATLREPTLFGSHWVPSYSTYTERRGEYKAYLRTTYIGGEAAATRDIGFQMPLRLAYTLEYGQTNAQPAVLCAVFSRCSAPEQAEVQRRLPLAIASASIQRTRTDNPFDPSSGDVLAAELRGAAPVIGSDPSLSFLKGTIDGSWYYKLRSRTVLAFRLRAGAITGGTETGGGARLPPPQERLYAGGANSVRGYQQNELGSLVYLIDSSAVHTVPLTGDTVAVVANSANPHVLRSIPVGGNSLIVANVELRLRDPFFPNLLQYVLFVDAGQVWTRETGAPNLGFGTLEPVATPGIALRYFSPVGPIQVNAGYNPHGNAQGPAYLLSTNSSGSVAPLICVTSFGQSPVKVLRDPATGDLSPIGSSCPSNFAPPRASSFLKRFQLTISVGTDF